MTEPTASTSPPERARRGSNAVAWVVSLALAAVVGAVLFAGGYLAGGGGSLIFILGATGGLGGG